MQVKDYKKFISYQKSHNVSWSQVWDCDQKRAFMYYRAHMTACNAVDFDDLLMIVDTTLSQQPAVLRQMQATYQHLLVDEFQVRCATPPFSRRACGQHLASATQHCMHQASQADAGAAWQTSS